MNKKSMKVKDDLLKDENKTSNGLNTDLQDIQSILTTAEEVAQIGSWRWDLRTQKVTWSDQMYRLFGVERDGFDGDVNRVVSERVHPDDAAAVLESNRSVLENDNPIPLSYRIVLPNGTERTVWAQGKMIRDEAGQRIALTGYVQDITERVRSETKILQMKRLYAALSQVNQTIVRVKNREELYPAICDVAVKFGEFSLAWIGLLDDDTGDINSVAVSGKTQADWSFPIANIYSNDYRQGIIANAIRLSEVVTDEDIQGSEPPTPQRRQIRESGYQSMAGIPFRMRDRVVGVLVLLSREKGLFKSEDELRLLDEMGLDISFALDMLETAKEAASLAKFPSENPNPVLRVGRNGRILYANLASAPLLTAWRCEVGQVLPYDWQKRTASVFYSTGAVEFDMDCGDRIFSCNIAPVLAEEYVNIYARDVTERKEAEDALRLENERFLQFSKSNIVGIVIAEAGGKVLFANDYYLNLLGVTRQDFEDGKVDWRTFTPPEWLSADEKAIRELQERGVCDPYEKEYERADGCRVSVYLANAMLPGHGAQIAAFILDITERKRAETALKRNERVLRLFVEHSPASIAMFDLEMKYIVASRRYLVDYGLGEQNLTGRSHYEVFPEMPERWKEIHRRCLAGAIERADEDPFPRADGHIDWVHWEIHPWYEEAGKIGGVILFSEVVTERKRAQEALKQSEESYRHTLDNMLEGFQIIDFDWRYMYVNDAAALQGRVPRDAMLHKTMMELYPGIEKTELFAALRDCMENRTTCQMDNIFVYPDGSSGYFEVSIQPIPEGLFILSIDITERKHAEQAVRAAEDKYRNIFENAVEAITQTTPNGKYISANPAAAQILGYDSPQDLMECLSNLDQQFYVKPGRREEFRKLMNQQGFVSDFESEVYRKDGSRIWVSENAHVVLDDHGNALFYEGAGQDITARKHAGQEIQQRTQDLLLISALNDAANRGENIADITEVFARETRDMFSCQAAAIYLLSADGKYLEMQSNTLPQKLTERIEKLIGRSVPKIQISLREDGYFRKILENEQGLITSDPRVIQGWIEEFTDTHFLSPLFRAAIRKIIPQIYKILNIGSTISIPLMTSGRAFGVLDMSSKGQFTEDDLRRIRSISHQVTAVILRKQAEQQVQLQLERMRALREIDRAISSSLDMRFSLDILLTQVLSQLGVDAASVLLLNPSSQTLEYEAGKGFRSLSIRESRVLLGQGFAGRAGLERNVIHITDLVAAGDQFLRAELLKDEMFVEYFGIPLIAKGVVKGVLEVFHRSPLNPDAEWVNYLETLGGQAAIALDNAQLFDAMQQSNLELITAYDATIVGWSRAMDLRDKETEGHTLRVTELTVQLAKKMGVSQQEITHMRRGALLHDIGKLGVPDHILHKPDELDRIEWAVMRQHPTYAFNMLMPINYLRPALDIPYSHHEKWDGSGYPRGLKGEEIPISARIFAIVDVWDALRSDRPYRNGWSPEKIRQHLIDESGKHFDPQVVDVFLQIIKDE